MVKYYTTNLLFVHFQIGCAKAKTRYKSSMLYINAVVKTLIKSWHLVNVHQYEDIHVCGFMICVILFYLKRNKFCNKSCVKNETKSSTIHYKVNINNFLTLFLLWLIVFKNAIRILKNNIAKLRILHADQFPLIVVQELC